MSEKIKHPNCEGDNCRYTSGEVRKVQQGDNVKLLCFFCCQKLPNWQDLNWKDLEIYDPTGGLRKYQTFSDDNTAYTDDGKVWRWVCNDAVVPLDIAAEYKIPIDIDAQQKAQEDDWAKIIAGYRKTYIRPSAEERAEARAVHGAGVTLVNVLTGQKWET